MGVEVFYDPDLKLGYFFCNTADTVFGECLYADSKDILQDFLAYWFDHFGDPRGNKKLDEQDKIYTQWLRIAHTAIYKRIYGDD